MSGDISAYLGLITSEHAPRSKFVAAVSAAVQPFADLTVIGREIAELYDLDVSVGEQEDVVGQWVGRSRIFTIPLTGVYFSFDTQFVGFDQGTWFGPFDPTSGLQSLSDDAYRQLLRAKIASNSWDGTIPGAYAAWATLFAGQDLQILIQDNGDMTMLTAFYGQLPDATTLALLTGGYLDLRPAGVGITYMLPTMGDTPFFGFDSEGTYIAGFDHGAWGNTDLSNPIFFRILTSDSGTILVGDDGSTILVAG